MGKWKGAKKGHAGRQVKGEGGVVAGYAQEG